jgi:hypothetical protein
MNLNLEDRANFTYLFNHLYFMKTTKGNFLFSHPEYPNGDNTIKPTDKSYNQILKDLGVPYGRSSGDHKISTFCGTSVKILTLK